MMRAIIKDLAHHPKWIRIWWEDLPGRKVYWWRELLLEPGTGWLRWKTDWRKRISYEPPDIEEWVEAPPLRRAYRWVEAWFYAWWYHDEI